MLIQVMPILVRLDVDGIPLTFAGNDGFIRV